MFFLDDSSPKIGEYHSIDRNLLSPINHINHSMEWLKGRIAHFWDFLSRVANHDMGVSINGGTQKWMVYFIQSRKMEVSSSENGGDPNSSLVFVNGKNPI